MLKNILTTSLIGALYLQNCLVQGQGQQRNQDESSSVGSSSSNSMSVYHRVFRSKDDHQHRAVFGKRGYIVPGLALDSAQWKVANDDQDADQEQICNMVNQEQDASTSSSSILYQIGIGESPDSLTSMYSFPLEQIKKACEIELQEEINLTLNEYGKPVQLRYKAYGKLPKKASSSKSASTTATTATTKQPNKNNSPFVPSSAEQPVKNKHVLVNLDRIPMPEKVKMHEAVKVEFDESGKEKAPEPEKSFLQKYWMYLLPVAVLLLTSGAPEESQGQGQGQGQQRSS